MPKLYSYTITHDSGFAPNPFWDVCTLVTCKPGIRKKARVKDWIVATGSAKRGTEGKVVFAMEVSKVMTLKEYDSYCKSYLENKIPVMNSKDPRILAGDCIYDYKKGFPELRDSRHSNDNKPTDLSGKNALLSNHFFYFGKEAKALPDHLLPIIQKRGFKSDSNDVYFESFMEWLSIFNDSKNKVISNPDLFEELSKEGIKKNSCSYTPKVEKEEIKKKTC